MDIKIHFYCKHCSKPFYISQYDTKFCFYCGDCRDSKEQTQHKILHRFAII